MYTFKKGFKKHSVYAPIQQGTGTVKQYIHAYKVNGSGKFTRKCCICGKELGIDEIPWFAQTDMGRGVFCEKCAEVVKNSK